MPASQSKLSQSELSQSELSWHQMTPIEVAHEFEVDLVQGLSSVEALARLKKYGPNLHCRETKKFGLATWERLLRLALPPILFVAALISLLVFFQFGLSLLLAALASLMILGTYPDLKAGKNGTPLESKVIVRRDGQLTVIDCSEVVPGDIAILATGTRVPADGRIYMAARLSIEETLITGCSNPAWKTSAIVETGQARLAERKNMAFMGTSVKHGYGTMIVTSTGAQTELGRTSGLHNQIEREKKLLWRLRRQMTIEFARVY